MIHVDVKRASDAPRADYLVQASTDGAGWRTQYIVAATVGTPSMDDAERRREAEDIARVFAHGCRYAGAELRVTSCGYAL